ncbi:hypothetical protein ACFLTA_03600 [Bacteroidota bacterium]
MQQTEVETYSEEDFKKKTISDPEHLSATSKGALERNHGRGPEWLCQFKESDLKAIE